MPNPALNNLLKLYLKQKSQRADSELDCSSETSYLSMCSLIRTFEDRGAVPRAVALFKEVKFDGARWTLTGHCDSFRFEVDSSTLIAKGATGVAVLGTYYKMGDERPCVIKFFFKSASFWNVLGREVLCQTFLWCFLSQTRGLAIQVPEVYFAAFSARAPFIRAGADILGRIVENNVHFCVGMQRVQISFYERMRTLLNANLTREATELFIRSMHTLASSLKILQERIQFMHGDLHKGNLMLGERDAPFLIDFNDASLQVAGASSRFVVGKRYRKKGDYKTSTDLLMLMMSFVNERFLKLNTQSNCEVYSFCWEVIQDYYKVPSRSLKTKKPLFYAAYDKSSFYEKTQPEAFLKLLDAFRVAQGFTERVYSGGESLIHRYQEGGIVA